MSDYTVDIIEKISNDDFNVVWEGCKEDIMSDSVFPWGEFDAITEEEKKEKARSIYRLYASDPEKTVIRVGAGARCLSLIAGIIETEESNFQWNMWLAGNDAQNSKSWMYTEDMNTVRAQIRETMGTTTASFNMLQGDTVVSRNIQSLINADTFALEAEDTVSDNVVIKKVTFGG